MKVLFPTLAQLPGMESTIKLQWTTYSLNQTFERRDGVSFSSEVVCNDVSALHNISYVLYNPAKYL